MTLRISLASAVLLLVSQAQAQTPPPLTPAPTSAPPVAETAAPAATEPAPTVTEPTPAPTPPPAPTPAAAAPPAAPPVEEEHKSSKIYDRLEAGGFLGWGIQLDGQDTRPFGFAIGLRGGAVLPNHLYAGLMLGVFAGQSERSYAYGSIYNYTVSLWQSQIGVEGGYDFDFGPVTLRPYLGLGFNRTIVSVSSSFGYSSAELGSTTDLYVNVGGMGHIKLTDRVYGGVDTRLDLVSSGPMRSALVVAASGGVMFP